MAAHADVRQLVPIRFLAFAIPAAVIGCGVPLADLGGGGDDDSVDAGEPGYPDGNIPLFPDAWTSDGGGACDGVDCSGHGVCVPVDGVATCVCEDGYVAQGVACVPSDPDASGCLAGAGDYVDEGPYETEAVAGPLGYTVFRPTSFEPDCLHPIVAWGNGSGVTGTAIYAHLNRHLASWGVVVIASHNSMVGSGLDHREGIDWLLAESANPASQYYGKLSPRAGVAGHSQGGLGASAAASHSNVEAEVNMQGGGSPAGKAALLLTGTADFMNSSVQMSYGLSTGPTFLASYLGADHITTPTALGALTPGGIQYKRLYAAWFRCFLADDENACALFAGGDECGICSDPGWAELKSKNLAAAPTGEP